MSAALQKLEQLLSRVQTRRNEPRVLAVADVYDALTSDRPYRAGMTREKAIGIMQEGAGTWLDADILAAFIAIGYDVTEFDVPAALVTESNALEQSRQPVPM